MKNHDGLSHDLESPEEHGSGHKKAPRGSGGPFDSGFSEGHHGRGPSPYHKGKHSTHPDGHPLEHHAANAGRGGTGIIGKGDGFKGRTHDTAHPQDHAEFEALGVKD